MSVLQSYTSPGKYRWTCPEGVTKVRVTISGGGGGGGFKYNSSYSKNNVMGEDGKDGGLFSEEIDVIPNTIYIINVGKGGTTLGMGDNSAVGGDGEESSFGQYGEYFAAGGKGGGLNGAKIYD